MTPVILVTGIDSAAMAATTISLQWDLPQAVVMEHRLDVETQRLTRLVSDAGGVIEHVYHDLDHACVSCALREDVVPTLERLAASGRWGAIIAHLPVAAEALQVCRVVAHHPKAAPHVTIAGVVTALDGPGALRDLVGDDLLRERGLHTAEDDTRGVAEAAAAIVEYADAVVVVGEADETGLDLLRTLSRPGARLELDPSRLDAQALAGGVHDSATTERWVDVVRRGPLPASTCPGVWTLDLRSDRPLHPGRLLDHIEVLGSGPRRSRGCFWLPSRPGSICVWDGAGGQLSVGAGLLWGRGRPLTRIVVVGTDDDRGALREAFDACLLTDTEIARDGMFWDVASDGLEPWLGEIRDAA